MLLRWIDVIKFANQGNPAPDRKDPRSDEEWGKILTPAQFQVTYDPAEIRYEDLLRVHLGTHNPTTLNQQGADKGTQYRSIIFYRDEEEKAIALRLLEELGAVMDKPVVTEVQPFEAFYAAETQHQGYYQRNVGKPYCEAVIEPKLAKFRESFATLARKESA